MPPPWANWVGKPSSTPSWTDSPFPIRLTIWRGSSTPASARIASGLKLNEPGAAWWVAERDGELLAFANTGPNTLPHPEARPSHAELRRLYVSKRAQGLGLGTKLLAVALEWMEAHTDGPLWIGVWSGNLKAQKLYAAYGFEKAGEYQYPVGDWLDDEFILRRQ